MTVVPPDVRVHRTRQEQRRGTGWHPGAVVRRPASSTRSPQKPFAHRKRTRKQNGGHTPPVRLSSWGRQALAGLLLQSVLSSAPSPRSGPHPAMADGGYKKVRQLGAMQKLGGLPETLPWDREGAVHAGASGPSDAFAAFWASSGWTGRTDAQRRRTHADPASGARGASAAASAGTKWVRQLGRERARASTARAEELLSFQLCQR